MKKIFFLVFCLAGYMSGNACTNLIVGKKASADGSVICSYCCDDAGCVGGLFFMPAAHHAKGELLPIHSWKRSGDVKGFIPQPEYTNNVMGYINDHQVSILETTWGGRKELVNPEGLFHFRTMMVLGLERANTAREAIKVMTDLVAQYGYKSGGEAITICDKNEAWMMEIVGKGPGEKGAVWVAIRIPDDCICAHANISRIRQFPLNDKENCLYAKDVISFARKKGYFKGKDADFSFRDAYCPFDFMDVRFTDLRVWSFFRHHTDTAEMDKYLPYLNGEFDKCDHLPLYVKVNKPVSVRDVMNDMRDHYEGTVFDRTADISAGPWGSPVSPTNSFTVNGQRYFQERSIATPKSEFTLVCQLRSWLPDDIGGIEYFTCDDASTTAYVPVYAGCNVIPAPFDVSRMKYDEFDPTNAFWMSNFVSNMVYPRYSALMPDLKDAQKELEDFYEQDQKKVEKEVANLVTTDRIDYLTKKSAEYTTMMMNRWDKLAKFLIVKHNDQLVIPSENGQLQFQSSKSAKADHYVPSFYEGVVKLTGDRYKVK